MAKKSGCNYTYILHDDTGSHVAVSDSRLYSVGGIEIPKKLFDEAKKTGWLDKEFGGVHFQIIREGFHAVSTD